ncbi:hypothetical protein [Agarilytica rhodophyticola]|uniref:hypothetical protein n=1 Tax=Agarilytica rhodophyticola TaxID=1737490 RepID=UPI000B345869|nr:hypothetical protein [Agarilytica rhodophyticola]
MEIILKILGGILSTIIVGYFYSRAENKETDGKLYFGGFILSVAIFCFLFSAGMLWIWLFVNHGGQDIPIAFSGFGFGIGFVYMFLEYYFTKGSYDLIGIKFYSLWSGHREYAWSDLARVDYNNIFHWHIFEFSDGKKILISSYLNGQKGLFEVLEEYDRKNI